MVQIQCFRYAFCVRVEYWKNKNRKVRHLIKNKWVKWVEKVVYKTNQTWALEEENKTLNQARIWKKVKCYETNPALVHLTKYKHKLQLCTWESNDQYQYYYRIDTSNIRIVSAHINARISHIASTITWLNQFTLICRLYMTFTILWSVKYSNFEMVNAKKCACILQHIVNLFALNVVLVLHTVSIKTCSVYRLQSVYIIWRLNYNMLYTHLSFVHHHHHGPRSSMDWSSLCQNGQLESAHRWSG